MYARPTLVALALLTFSFGAIVPVPAEADSPPVYLGKWGSSGPGPEQFQGIQGLAIDGSNNVYVADPQSGAIKKFTAIGEYLTQWNAGYAIDVAIGPDGTFYVGDVMGHRVIHLSSEGVWLGVWGFNESSGLPYAFASICGIAADAHGFVYVSDSGSHRIQKFTGTGVFVTQWGYQNGGTGSAPGQFNCPCGLAADTQSNVYVADIFNYRVQKFTGDGLYLAQWGVQGDGEGQFFYPVRIAIDTADNVYVVDNANDRVEKFSSSGSFLTAWGTKWLGVGEGNGQFHDPWGIAISHAGVIYVGDTGLHRIQYFGEAPTAAHGSTWGRIKADYRK